MKFSIPLILIALCLTAFTKTENQENVTTFYDNEVKLWERRIANIEKNIKETKDDELKARLEASSDIMKNQLASIRQDVSELKNTHNPKNVEKLHRKLAFETSQVRRVFHRTGLAE